MDGRGMIVREIQVFSLERDSRSRRLRHGAIYQARKRGGLTADAIFGGFGSRAPV
ncbi:hypothetical protein C7408_102471 [Paraburkholderia caballeronis]|nr:hypothetical protein C7408_102471 [Paraburkholderia caballeronis]TDV22325.1 hypothetical protein C7406_101470 [Paraburkholderia caballeronis]TDV29229.1 hypothetical protein C7404_102471 [Paraburkholderia caballeronis]